MAKEKILILFGRSAYDALNTYLREIGAAYSEMGYEVEYFDGRRPDYPDALYDVTSNNEYKAVIACNAMLTGWDKMVLKDAIFCCLMFDHPIVLKERIEIADENALIIHCDLRGAEYIARYFPNVGSVGFVPLSGSFINEGVAHKSYMDRQYDVLFTGSYMDSGKIYDEQIAVLKELDRNYADVLIDIMKENPMLMMQDALLLICEELQIDISDKEFNSTMFRLRGVETYMRAWAREQVFRSIVDSGIKVNVFGNNWESFDCRNPENIIRMEGYGETSLKALTDTKIALNVMPWFRGGFQERIASAMLSGAVALTDTSTYIEENFTDGEDIAIYNLSRIEDIPDIIKDLLDNPQKAAKIAENGYNKAINGHTWKHRAEEIMQTIDSAIEWRGCHISPE